MKYIAMVFLCLLFLQIFPPKIVDLFINNLCNAIHIIDDTVNRNLSVEVITESR